ncbi:rhodanese-like domain-containing protein [Streptomyces sp. NPDC001339]|uniref:rhodanese-like domain-containing protein n=1 Tax=Streptomyces sp. NPDC001339 TaxID=3364563 RepID=UPI00368A0A84
MSAVDALLARARRELGRRVDPQEAAAAQKAGGLLVDIRYAQLRARDGAIPGALIVERNELEWRLDPTSPHRAPAATHHDLPIIVICNEGYASTLAALSLRRLGLHRATDLAGGFQSWRRAGFPVLNRPADADPAAPDPLLPLPGPV